MLTEVEVQTRDTVIGVARTHARKTLRNGISLLYLLTLDVDLGAVHERRMVLCRACAKRLVAACGKLFDIGSLAAAAVQRLNGNIDGTCISTLKRYLIARHAEAASLGIKADLDLKIVKPALGLAAQGQNILAHAALEIIDLTNIFCLKRDRALCVRGKADAYHIIRIGRPQLAAVVNSVEVILNACYTVLKIKLAGVVVEINIILVKSYPQLARGLEGLDTAEAVLHVLLRPLVSLGGMTVHKHLVDVVEAALQALRVVKGSARPKKLLVELEVLLGNTSAQHCGNISGTDGRTVLPVVRLVIQVKELTLMQFFLIHYVYPFGNGGTVPRRLNTVVV